MIVKVQLSITSSDGIQKVLIYDKSKSIMYQEDANQDIIGKMDGEVKKFFNARINKKGILELINPTDFQDW